MNPNSNKDGHDNDPNIYDAIKKIVENGENIRDQVRDIIVETLSKEHLDKDYIESVIRSTWEGAKHGSERHGEHVKQIFIDVMAGLDEALEKYAYASKLAIEETVGRMQEFTKHDLKRTLEDLQGMEEMFLDIMTEAAKNTKNTFADILTDLVSHAKNSGTEVGQRAIKEFDSLSAKLGETGKESINAVGDAASTFGANVARTASSFLADVANKLKPDKNDKL